MVVEDLPGILEETEDCWIAHRVKDVLAFLAAFHDVAFPQNRQLLRQRALFHRETGAQIVDPDLALAERLQDLDPQRVSQRFEEFRGETREFRHEYAYICIFRRAEETIFLPSMVTD